MKLRLKKKERNFLQNFVKKGSKSARALTRARILLLADKGKKDVELKELLVVGRSTIWRVKMNYLNKGVEYALTERERPGQPPKYDDKKKAEIIAYACTKAPSGRNRWTVRLLAEELCKQDKFKTINREYVRIILKKAKLSLG